MMRIQRNEQKERAVFYIYLYLMQWKPDNLFLLQWSYFWN